MVSEIWVPQSLAQVLPALTSFWPLGKPIGGKWSNNYDVRQVHETLNGVNPSSSFRDVCVPQNLDPICGKFDKFFGPWASPYGAKGQMTMTVHNYRPKQFHRTLNGENLSSRKPLQRYEFRKFGSRPPARPPQPWRQYSSSPKGWGVKSWNDQALKYKWVSEWLNWTAFLGTADGEVHIVLNLESSPYKPCNHSLYIGIIIFPHIDNTIYRPQLTLRKNILKMKHKKVRAPIKLTCHWRRQLYISLQSH